MLKLYPSFLIFLSGLLFCSNAIHSQNCTYVWNPQTSGTTSQLYSVKAVSESICWAAGSSATVRRTTDGGLTWQNGNPNPGVINGNILNLEALDANNAWVTTSVSVNTFIYKTSNGGNSWVQVYTSNGGFINGIRMQNLTHGIALGDPVSNVWNIITTTNGGVNWTPLLTSPSAQAGESGFHNSFHISFPNIWIGSSFGSVYKSTNNGLTWSNHVTPGIAIYVFSVYFNSQNLGFASGTTMVKSTNGGENYAQHPAAGAGNIDNIDGSGNNVWYVRGQNIYYSSTSGDSWNPVHTSPSTLLDIDFIEGSNGCLTGWAVGYGGNVHKMTGSLVGISGNNSNLSVSYSLHQNYPNPFNPSTEISFSIPKPGYTELKIYDMLGNEVREITGSHLAAGTYSFTLNSENMPSGVYIYKLKSGSFSESRKMILVK